MNKTPIEWVKNPDGTQGYTWNPITGCLNHTPEGLCFGGMFPCYAYKLANGRLKSRYLANQNIASQCFEYRSHIPSPYIDPFYPRFWEDRLFEPVNKERRWGRQRRVVHTQEPKGIFVCDMSDLFGIGIPEEWTRRVLDRFQYAPQHRFYLLTKQPQNLVKFSPFPDNCWVGVTATNTEMLMQACSYLEYPIQAKVKYLSIEPFLGWDFNWNQSYLVNCLKRADIGLVIIGSQTKPYKPPKIEWVEEIVRACDKAGIPVFMKENLMPLFDFPVPGLFTKKFPAGRLELRQEMPK